MADFEDTNAGYDGEPTPARHIARSRQEANFHAEGRGYERRDRSASPRGDREEHARSRSPNGRAP